MPDLNGSNYKEIEWLEHNLIEKLDSINDELKIDTKYILMGITMNFTSIALTYFFAQLMLSLNIHVFIQLVSIPIIYLIIYNILKRINLLRGLKESAKNIDIQNNYIKKFDKCISNKLLLCYAFINKYEDPNNAKLKDYYFVEILHYLRKAVIIQINIINNLFDEIIDIGGEIPKKIASPITIDRFELSCQMIYKICYFVYINAPYTTESLSTISAEKLDTQVTEISNLYKSIYNELENRGIIFKNFPPEL